MTGETAQLGALIEGRVLLPGQDDYDLARRTFNGMIDRKPAAIVRPTGAADVARAVRWADANDLAIAVRGGGHTSGAIPSSSGRCAVAAGTSGS